MPTQPVAGSLAYSLWALLAPLALGIVAAAVAARLLTDATRGYVALTAFLGGLLALAALSVDSGLPAPGALRIVAAPELDGARRAGLLLLAGGGFSYTVVVAARGARAPVLGVAAVACGVLAIVLGAVGWEGSLAVGLPAGLHLLVLAAATGGVTAAMILGHWYLVTPHLSERPLVLAARALTLVLALQLALFVVWAALGLGTDGRPFAALVGGAAIFVWLRLLVGLAFPLVLSWMAERTARSRSMESATGLLYIDTAAILAGTIVATALWVGAGLLV
ncbi:MAG TPA: hypothetical protein VFK38_05450 [Candidatus Limnocylindrales bacterium]|nr:hypothetical protein [Candidatus Limnocylindrales bacterium]